MLFNTIGTVFAGIAMLTMLLALWFIVTAVFAAVTYRKKMWSYSDIRVVDDDVLEQLTFIGDAVMAIAVFLSVAYSLGSLALALMV